MTHTMSWHRKLAWGIGVAAFWLAVWTLMAQAVDKPLLLPGPFLVVEKLWEMLPTAVFWRAAGASLLRITLGFVLGLAVGSMLALLCHMSSVAHRLFAPVLAAARATPVATFILLALIWIKVDGVPVFTAALIVLPVAYSNLLAGLSSLDNRLSEMAKVYGLTRTQRFLKVELPQLAPFGKAVITAGMGMAWKAGIAAEVLSTPRAALGTGLYMAKIYLDTPSLFAYTAAVIVASVLLEKLVLSLCYGTPKGVSR